MKPNVRPQPYSLIFSVLSVLTLLQYILLHLLSPEVELLDEIQTKVFRIFLIQSPLQLSLEIFISSNSSNLCKVERRKTR